MHANLAVTALLLAAATALPAAAAPYDGVWASDAAACRDPDGVDRLVVGAGSFTWYETQCRAGRVRGTGPWIVPMACSGEGQSFRVQARLAMPDPSRLAITHGPVGRTGDTAYRRCARR
jgi:hypothetical protein